MKPPMLDDQRYFCRCGWELPTLTLDVEYPPHVEPATHYRVMVCCPRCDTFVQVAVDVPTDGGAEYGS